VLLLVVIDKNRRREPFHFSKRQTTKYTQTTTRSSARHRRRPIVLLRPTNKTKKKQSIMTTTKQKTAVVYFLTGDIGGTNSRLYLYDSRHPTISSTGGTTTPLAHQTFLNRNHILPVADRATDATIFQRTIIIPFLAHCWANQSQYGLLDIDDVVIRVVLAVAGVVQDNAVRVTNLDNMVIDGHRLGRMAMDKNDPTSVYARAIVSCTIMNDFVAQGYGCLTLQSHEVRHLYGPENMSDQRYGPKVCIGAGTGLGECYLTAPPPPVAVVRSPNDTNPLLPPPQYTCFPSEGGHVEYAPRNGLEIKMFRYLSHKFGAAHHDENTAMHRISVERVVSGLGLANVYEFLATEFPLLVDETLHNAYLVADDRGKIVAEHIETNQLCRQALSVLLSAYGCEAGSAALKWIPTGGLYISGGLTPKHIDRMTGLESDFMRAYVNKGRVAPLLATIPLYAVLVEDLGVRGAYQAAVMEYEQQSQSLLLPQQSSPERTSATTTTMSHNGHAKMEVQCWAGVAALVVTSFGLGVLLGGRRQRSPS
jgi:glucokinase